MARFIFSSIFLLFSLANAGKVLFYIPFSSKSMKITYTPLIEELTNRGHEITVVMPFKDPKAKYKIINTDPEENIIKMIDTITEPVLSKQESNMASLFFRFKENVLKLNENALSNAEMKKLIEDPNTRFDLVVVCPFLGSEMGYYLAHRFKAPIGIYFTGQSQMNYVNHAIGQPFNPSYMTMPMLPFENGNMNFVQRCINTFVSFGIEHIFRNLIVLGNAKEVLDRYIPDDQNKPDLLDLEKNVSLVMSFGHPMILDGWSPSMPNYVPLGMMNCRPGKAFEKGDRIGDFLANSKNGVVYVSFGSVLKPSLMSYGSKQILLRTFGRFPQYDFLWKWDQDEMEGKPDNVLLSKWLPQQDILAHPKLKLFVTHAGQSSFQETLCHQKPVIAIPVTGDQPINAKEAERMEIGIMQPYADLNEEELVKALDKVLHDSKYTENAKKYGAILNDQETRPLDRAIWWIEHVMRHPFMYQGKTPTHKLYWFQYFSLDVFLLYAIVLYVVFKILKFLVFLALVGCWQSNKIKVE